MQHRCHQLFFKRLSDYMRKCSFTVKKFIRKFSWHTQFFDTKNSNCTCSNFYKHAHEYIYGLVVNMFPSLQKFLTLLFIVKKSCSKMFMNVFVLNFPPYKTCFLPTNANRLILLITHPQTSLNFSTLKILLLPNSFPPVKTFKNF